MFSLNPRVDNFQLILPDTFFIDDITAQYNKFFQAKNEIYDDVETILRESIQNFETPEFGITPIEQQVQDGQGGTYPIYQYPKTSQQLAVDAKTFQISFRHSDGFITYFMMLEHFFRRLTIGESAMKSNTIGSIFCETMMPDGRTVARFKFSDVLFIGIPSLSLTYSTPARDLSSFTCSFAYDTFSTDFEIPDLKLK